MSAIPSKTAAFWQRRLGRTLSTPPRNRFRTLRDERSHGPPTSEPVNNLAVLLEDEDLTDLPTHETLMRSQHERARSPPRTSTTITDEIPASNKGSLPRGQTPSPDLGEVDSLFHCDSDPETPISLYTQTLQTQSHTRKRKAETELVADDVHKSDQRTASPSSCSSKQSRTSKDPAILTWAQKKQLAGKLYDVNPMLTSLHENWFDVEPAPYRSNDVVADPLMAKVYNEGIVRIKIRFVYTNPPVINIDNQFHAVTAWSKSLRRVDGKGIVSMKMLTETLLSEEDGNVGDFELIWFPKYPSRTHAKRIENIKDLQAAVKNTSKKASPAGAPFKEVYLQGVRADDSIWTKKNEDGSPVVQLPRPM